jgi:hypothetical protein
MYVNSIYDIHDHVRATQKLFRWVGEMLFMSAWAAQIEVGGSLDKPVHRTVTVKQDYALCGSSLLLYW